MSAPATTTDRESVTALILAAGRGTRMRSTRAKVLAPLFGRPLLVWAVEAARQAGAGTIVAVVGYDRAAVIAALPAGVGWVEQPEQRGTGDAVRSAEARLGDSPGWLLILPGDLPLLRGESLARLVAAARLAERQGAAGAVLSVTVRPESAFGRVLRDATGARAARIVEYRDATAEERRLDEGNAGVYCLRASALFGALHQVGCANAQGEYYLTDVVALLAEAGRGLAVVRLADPEEARSVDTPEALAEAEARLARPAPTRRK